jgi:hypothetical protein
MVWIVGTVEEELDGDVETGLLAPLGAEALDVETERQMLDGADVACLTRRELTSCLTPIADLRISPVLRLYPRDPVHAPRAPDSSVLIVGG